MTNEQIIHSTALNLRPQDRFKNPKNLPLFDNADTFYCSFRIMAPKLSGVYQLLVDNQLMYIGRAKSLKSRLSDQYGTVSPRHPFKGGQKQKCRINALINAALVSNRTVSVKWQVCEDFIEKEHRLLSRLSEKPSWNIRI